MAMLVSRLSAPGAFATRLRDFFVLSLMMGVYVSSAHAQMHATVQDDRVQLHDSEFVPRFATYLPNALIVRNGEVVTLPPDATYDAIEVQANGVLHCSRTYRTTLRVTHFMVLPGGTFDCGTTDEPVRAEFIIRDVAIDTARDPFQWGNGILNFGRQTRVGRAKTAFVELAAEAPAGANTLALASVPVGWEIGDELVLPDTRQTGFSRELAPRRDPPVRIASIDGTTVTLAQPLSFARQNIRDPDGVLVLRPRVINLTRDIVIRSEAPLGVRGHTVEVGHEASWQIVGNEFVGLGRTLIEPLDNTSDDRHRIGRNQAGRYADHYHHARDASGSETSGNAYRGDGRSKWALVLHQTDRVRVERNVCVEAAGACFVTEDGNEVENVFRGNIAAYAKPTGLHVNHTQGEMDRGCPGCEGTGFWFRGVHQVIEGNEAWNNAQGINLVLHVVGRADARPFSLPSSLSTPVSFRSNIAASNQSSGLEYWGMPRFPAYDQTSAHNGMTQVALTGPPGNSGYFLNLTAVASGGRTVCLEGSVGYIVSVEVDGGMLAGCEIGASRDGIAAESAVFRNVVMQNKINFNHASGPYTVTFENVIHKPLPAHPPRYIVFGTNSDVWQRGTPLNARGAMYLWNHQRGSLHRIINWQGTGQDYRLFLPGQISEAPAWPAVGDRFFNLVPEDGLTMGEAWGKYGMALRGGTVDSGSIVPLEGLVNGIASAGSMTDLGAPKAIMTTPNLLYRPQVERGHLVMYFSLTGKRDVATEIAWFQINGGKVRSTSASRWGDIVKAGIPLSEFTEGDYTVNTWRQNSSGAKVAGSEMTFRFAFRPAEAEK